MLSRTRWHDALLLVIFAGLVCGKVASNRPRDLYPGVSGAGRGASVKANDKLTPPVQQLCDDYWDWKLEDMPEFATFVGIHTDDDKLDDLSLAAYDQRLAKVEDFMAILLELEPTLVEDTDIFNVQVLKEELQVYINGFPYKNFVQPLNYMEGPHVDLIRMISWMLLESFENYNTLIQRLSKVQTQLEQIELLLREGAKSGLIPHSVTMDGVAEMMDTFVVPNPDDCPIFQEYFVTFPANITEEQTMDLQSRARLVIEQQVMPGFAKLRDYVRDEYPARPDIAVTSLPNGTQLYKQLIKFHTGDSSTPEAIHQKGLEEVQRIDDLMQEIVYEVGYNMSIQEFSQMITSDPANFYDTADELMDAFNNIVYNIIIPTLPLAFINIPKAELILVASPTPDRPSAFYLSGSYDGSRPGVFYVNTYDPHSQPKFEMLTLSLHEGNPGHHLQGSHTIESTSIPYFRSVADDRNYAHSPSKLPMRTYYMEGWGLYAESVGFDMQLFADPLERYGHYSDEMFRACRLVVDTGIHAMGWSKQDAIDYMVANTAMTPGGVEREVNRYVTWPGQALAYKWGQLQFTKFRTSAEEKLGELFNLAEFHDVILESVGPMALVEVAVTEWVDSLLASADQREF